MEIKDLQIRQGNVDLVAEVVEKGQVREFQKFGKSGRVCTVKVRDSSGEIALSLWNEDIDKINVGDKIQVKNCYVNEWQGDPQLTTGKFGTIEVIGKAEEKAEKKPAGKKKGRKPKELEEEPEEEPGEEPDFEQEGFEEEVVE